MLKKLQILLFLIFLSLIGFAQLDGTAQKEKWAEDNIFLDGVITDYYNGENIPGVKITATGAGKTVSGNSDGKGEYKLVLAYDQVYTIVFSQASFTSKKITMNTNGVPDLKRQKVPDMAAEITLFQPNDCIESEMLAAPIGRAVYFSKKNIMDWDMDYSMSKLLALNQMLDDCANAAEETKEEEKRKEKEYNTVMKIADKAFAKEAWDDAIAHYKKAIAIFDDRPEPKNKLKLIETEIKQKAEAEKQRAEEKARAKAEAKARAEAEAAAKKAEQELKAKTAAEKEALAKAAEEAMEKSKAAAAAAKAAQEKLAKAQTQKLFKEKAEKEALAQRAALAKNAAKKEAVLKKAAEDKANEEKKKPLLKPKRQKKQSYWLSTRLR